MFTKANSLTLLSALLAIFVSTATYSAELPDAVRDALLKHELIERDVAYRTAPIHSKAELESYLRKQNPGNQTPLGLLSSAAQQRFLQSLVFTKGGLASFDTSDLRAELTATQVYRILAIFGAQDTTKSIPGLRVQDSTDAAIVGQGKLEAQPFADYYNYKCIPPATCVYNIQTICIGNNCGIPP